MPTTKPDAGVAPGPLFPLKVKTMKNSYPLSYSAYSKYVQCGESYKKHYIDRIRPKGTSSALIFGSAVDAGLNVLVMRQGDPVMEIRKHLNRCFVEPIDFSFYDYDKELVSNSEKKRLITLANKLGAKKKDIDALVKALFDKIKDGKELSKKQYKVLASACVASLETKASLMVEAYRKEILPLIEEVYSVQETHYWTDEEGQKFQAVIDLYCKMKGHGKVLIDHKTASQAYQTASVTSTPQLPIYTSFFDIDKAGFVVLEKSIQKNKKKICSVCGHDGTGKQHKTCDAVKFGQRCGGEWTVTINPKAKVSLILDKMPKRNEKLALETMSQASKGIKAGVFVKNLNTCKNIFNKPCPYINLCWKNDMTGLEELTNVSYKKK